MPDGVGMSCTCNFAPHCDGGGWIGCEYRYWGDGCSCQCGCELDCAGCENCGAWDELDDDERLFLEDEDGNPRGDA